MYIKEPEVKKLTNEDLFNKQKELLDLFLTKNAISKEQYTKSLNCLILNFKSDKNKNDK